MPHGFIESFDNLLFIFGLAYTLYLAQTDRDARMLLLSFGLFFCWSFVSQIQNGFDYTLSNIAYNFVFLKWAIILIVSMSITRNDTLNKYVPKVINATFLLLVAINLFLIINPYGVAEGLQHHYTSSNYSDFIYFHEPGSFRLAGTQLNPNDNALIWGCFILYYAQTIKRNWVFVIVAVGLLLLTQSRTVVLILACVGCFYIVKSIWRKAKLKTALVTLIPTILIGGIVLINSRYLMSIFNGNAFVSHSFLTRIENYCYLNTYSFLDLLIGRGIIQDAQETLGFSVDSEYLGVLFQFGIIGLICWIFILVVCMKISRFNKNFTKLLMFLIVFVSFTNFTILNLQLAVILTFFLGISLGKRSELTDLEKVQVLDK